MIQRGLVIPVPQQQAPQAPPQVQPSSQGFVQQSGGVPSYVEQQAPQQVQQPQVLQQAPQQQVPQGNPDIINGHHIDDLVNRKLPKASQPGYASAETLVRQFGLPIEMAAELVNESHARLEDWSMDLYEKAKDLAHLNVALQNHSNGQLDALEQQDELLKVYARQMLEHQEFMKNLHPHIERYEKMEQLLLDSALLEQYWKNLKAVEAEYGTHAENVAAQQAVIAKQQAEYRQVVDHYTNELVQKGHTPEEAQQQALAFVNQQLAIRQAEQSKLESVPVLPFEPGAILSQVDPSQLTKEQIEAVQGMSPSELKALEYQMAVNMGVIDQAGNLLNQEPGITSKPSGGYSQFVGNQRVTQAVDPSRIDPRIPPEARMQANVVQQSVPRQQAPQKETFIQQIINGAVPPSVYEVNQRMAQEQYEATRPMYNIPQKLDQSAIRPSLPAANPRGESAQYPTLDQLSPQQRFLLLDKMEQEGILGQKRVRV